VLAVVAGLGALLAYAVRAPEPAPRPALRGHRVFRVPPATVRGLELVLDDRRLAAERTAYGWTIADRPVEPATADALTDLVARLDQLRAVDVFRPRDTASYGLDRPRATITLRTGRGARRLLLGTLNAAGGALYARRERDPRVMQVGALLLSDLERVFYTRDRGGAR